MLNDDRLSARLPEDGKRLVVEVADDGGRFNVTAVSRGAGLTNMEDRVDALGGTLQIYRPRALGRHFAPQFPFPHRAGRGDCV